MKTNNLFLNFVDAATGVWGIHHLPSINSMLTSLPCPECNAVDSLNFAEDTLQRHGFASSLKLSCSICHHVVSDNFTSPRAATSKFSCAPYLINDMMTLFFNEMGLGYNAMKTFGTVLGIKVMHLKTFQKKESKIASLRCNDAHNVLDNAAHVVREFYQQSAPADQPGTDGHTLQDVGVSFDGSWLTRGHQSQYGIGAVIELQTGLILDYEVLSKHCLSCNQHSTVLGKDSEEYKQWYDEHKEECCCNYNGSSNSMEVECAKRLWSRSVARHGMRYVSMLGDGDSKAYQAVQQMQPYGEDCVIQREECINHAHKRMGTALLKLWKTEKIGGKGYGRLTEKKTQQFQKYYRGAIINNIGNPDGMRDAVWASLFHNMSTDEMPQHGKCPTGPDSWCFYNKAISNGMNPPPHQDHIRNAIAPEVGKAMEPVYTRMSDPNLLKRLSKGKTQNTNESFHGVVWSRCPKSKFVGKRKLDGAVARGISAYNEGARQLTSLMHALNVEVNMVSMLYEDHQDDKRQQNALAQRNTTEQRRAKSLAAKRERALLSRAEGPTYSSGGF